MTARGAHALPYNCALPILDRPMRLLIVLAALTLSLQSLPLAAQSSREFAVDYTVTLRPQTKDALVSIRIGGGGLVKQLTLTLKPDRQSQLKADGKLVVNATSATWQPPANGGTLTLAARIDHQRRGDGYDAWMDKRWAVFRGDDLVPVMRARTTKGARSKATLRFRLPPGWNSVNTGWKRNPDGSFAIDNPERRVDRPTGWMIAGDLGTRREKFPLTEVSVSAPTGSGLHRMDVLAFVSFLMPSFEAAFESLPPKILLVGAGDPLWRGALSASNSIFLHADRPLVSENGTSTLVHELVHVITRIRGQTPEDDWIAEGLAEFYAIELMHRAGGLTDARRTEVLDELTRWSAPVKTLRTRASTGATTARAALWFETLDAEIRKSSGGKRSLDAVVQALMKRREVSLAELRASAEKAAGAKLKAFDSALLR